MSPERKRLLHTIQAREFVAVDLSLYLDTHPNDRRALSEYNEVIKKLNEEKMEYERRYGPLTLYENVPVQTSWEWINGPWPWEITF